MRTLLLLLLLPATISAQEAYFAGINGDGMASACDINEAVGMVVKGENGENLNCVSFTMSVSVKNKTVEVHCKGNELCDSSKKLIKELKPGDILYIEDIIAENIYGVAIDIPPIKIAIAKCGKP